MLKTRFHRFLLKKMLHTAITYIEAPITGKQFQIKMLSFLNSEMNRGVALGTFLEKSVLPETVINILRIFQKETIIITLTS